MGSLNTNVLSKATFPSVKLFLLSLRQLVCLLPLLLRKEDLGGGGRNFFFYSKPSLAGRF